MCLLKYLRGNAMLPSYDCKRTPWIANWLLKSQSRVSSDLMHLFAEHLRKHLYSLAMTRLLVQFWYYYKYVLEMLWQNFVCYLELEFWPRDGTKLTWSISLHGSRVYFFTKFIQNETTVSPFVYVLHLTNWLLVDELRRKRWIKSGGENVWRYMKFVKTYFWCFVWPFSVAFFWLYENVQ